MIDKEEVVNMVLAGNEFKRIAEKLGCSRERIRQIAVKCGVYGEALKHREYRAYQVAKKNATSAKYGLPKELVKALRFNGATRAYTRQKANAKKRGIEWQFTIESWWAVWQESGKWEIRGRSGDSYVMARMGDEGPYAPGNVYICTRRQNTSDYQFIARPLRSAAKTGTFKRSINTR